MHLNVSLKTKNTQKVCLQAYMIIYNNIITTSPSATSLKAEISLTVNCYLLVMCDIYGMALLNTFYAVYRTTLA